MPPASSIGLPSSASAALLMGAFMLHDIAPGPFLFGDDTALVYAIFIGMVAASGIMLVMGMVGQNLFVRLITVSEVTLVPIIIFIVRDRRLSGRQWHVQRPHLRPVAALGPGLPGTERLTP